MRLGLGIAIGGSALVIFALATFASFQFATANRVSPGVTVLGVQTGGLTVDEAKARLNSRTAAILDEPLQLKAGDQTWTTTPRQLGVPLDPAELARDAYAVGRDDAPFASLSAKVTSLRGGIEVPVAEYADGSNVDGLMSQIGSTIYTPARNAELSVGDDGSVQFSPSSTGVELDQAASRAAVAAALETGDTSVSLVTRTLQPKVTTEQVAVARDQLTRIFNHEPVQVKAGDRGYTLETADLLGMIVLNASDGVGPASVDINTDTVQTWVDKIASDVNQPALDARFAYDGSTLTTIRPSRDGSGLDRQASSNTIETQILSGEHTIQLPITTLKPAVTSDDGGASLGIRELIDESTTSFAGSIPEKAHNIQLAAQRLNGVVVPPGGTFSFNKEVGPTTIEAGYQWGFGLTTGAQGAVHTVPSVAGGICQVATTLFQPVYWAGYQLEERYWHLYWIPSYTSRGIVGLDATVDSDAGLDLKWINPTKDYVLIQASSDASHVTFRLYGRKPPWKVQVEDPVISNTVKPDTTPDVQQEPLMQWGRIIPVETARDGFQVVLTRHVIPNDGSPQRDLVLKSIYDPGHNVTLVGTGGAPDAGSVTAAVNRVRGSLQPAAAAAPAAPSAASASSGSSGSSAPTAPAAAPAAPPAQAAPAGPTTVSTPNGSKTLAQIRDELRNAGWGGGSDQDAVATYNHVAGAAKAASH
ncbi:MAG: VanW family protein [Chloroflexi bacterium]|nr:VanW family protein [Chloroflexota bacterium]